MRITSPNTARESAWPPLPPHRFTVQQYHRMIESGVLTDEDRVELLDGWILPKPRYTPPHEATVSLVGRALLARLPDDWVVRIKCAVTMRNSEPEPDAVVAPGSSQHYMETHPEASQVGLVVEVADSTLQFDRVFKGPLYAKGCVPVYWLINLVDSVVEVYARPRSGKAPAYREHRDYEREEKLPLELPGRDFGEIPVRELIPKKKVEV